MRNIQWDWRTDEEVRSLHRFSLPTRIIEVGCGVALSNLLFSENNASHTISDVYSPYSREAQLKLEPELQKHRAVSLENTMLLMKHLLDSTPQQNMCFYVANFQIGGNPEQPKTTHGYIGVSGPKRKATYYHITIPFESTRKILLESIAETGFAILFNQQVQSSGIQDTFEELSINYADIVYDHEGHQKINETLELFLTKYTRSVTTDGFLCYLDGQFHRFEDFFRDKHNVLIYRGTFNPITNAHLEIFEAAKKQIDPDFSCFMIAHEIYDKPGLNLKEIKQRMLYADSLGIPLLIGSSYRYLDCITHFRSRQFNTSTKLNFLMGADTIERIFKSEKEDFYNDVQLENVAYCYVERKNYKISHEDDFKLINAGNFADHLKINKIKDFTDEFGISATQAREFLQTANLDELRRLIPEAVLQAIIKEQLCVLS